MKIYLNKINEDWVVDQFVKEWNNFKFDITTYNVKDSDIIWLIAPWTWKNVNTKMLKKKTVFCTVHHIDFKKFNKKVEKDFYKRDKYVDYYHAISENTKHQLEKLTDKKIIVAPFWLNQNNFFHIEDAISLKKKYGFKNEDFLIGSYQRDTEGADLLSPKLSKGPDRFLEMVLFYNRSIKNMTVVLTGRRRDYLINKFEEFDINYKYFEMVDYKDLNELYNILDLYIVSSRVEGGPRAVFECAITKTPIISTDVGHSSKILHPQSIFEMKNFEAAKPSVDFAYNNVIQYTIPLGIDNFEDIFRKIYEN